ncbi:MAG: hypothetical protein JWO77_3751 [Ilumatobacteraceae bacterium]|nr:hypothetical protein [Ilumatobacteraceae bacterium]
MVIIEPLDPIVTETTVTRRARVIGSHGADSLQIEIPAPIAGDVADHAHLVGLGIWPAILAQTDLHIEATVEAGHLNRIRRLLHIYRSWVPALPLPRVTVAAERATAVDQRGAGTAAYFSRGVDSMYEAALDTQARPPLTHLVFLDGIEPRHSPATAAAEVEAAAEAAALLGLPLHVVRTDVHALTGHARDWSDVHGCVLAALATSLGGEVGDVVIPSTDSYATLVPYGSHPLLDPLLSTSALTVRHGDIGAGRAGKVAALAAQRPDLLPFLKVCYEEDRPDNCGRCGKCIITMAALQAVGALHLATGFPDEIPLDKLRTMRPTPIQSRQHWIDVVRLLDDTGRAPEVRNAILHALRRAARPDAKKWRQIIREKRSGVRPSLHPSWKDPARGIDWTHHTDTIRVLDEGWSERLGHPLPEPPEGLRPPT